MSHRALFSDDSEWRARLPAATSAWLLSPAGSRRGRDGCLPLARFAREARAQAGERVDLRAGRF